MKKLTVTLALSFLLIPSVSFASSLTQPQVNAIISLLQAFDVDSTTIAKVALAIEPAGSASVLNVSPAPEPLAPQAVSPSVPGETEGRTFWPETAPPYIQTKPNWLSAFNNIASGIVDFSGYADVLTNEWTGIIVDVSIPGQSIAYAVDGTPIGAAIPNIGFPGLNIFQYNTTQLANGPHTLTITATDLGGTSTASMPINIENATTTPQ